MNDSILLLVVIFLFFILPFIGLIIVIRDIYKSKERGKELDKIASEFKENLELLRKVNLGEFNGVLSNWLETEVKTSKTRWIRASLRMAIQAKFIGFGEDHRDLLIENGEYRHKAINYCRQLAEAFEMGEPASILIDLSNLFAFFLCKPKDPINESDFDRTELVKVTVDALKFSSELAVNVRVLEAPRILSKAIKRIAQNCDLQDAGLALLILHWAAIRLQDKERSKIGFIVFPFDGGNKISQEFNRIASCFTKNDYWGILNVMAARY